MTGDENLDTSHQVSVVRMQAHLQLLAGPSVPPQYAASALLEVERDAQGHFALTAYHPPMLRTDASRFLDVHGAQHSLQAKLEQLSTKLWDKLRELAGNRSDDMPEDDEPAGGEAQRQQAIARHLAPCLPLLDLAAGSGQIRPEELYRVVAQVVGQVAGIGANPVPLKMEPYAHDDCMPRFQRAFDYIDAKLRLVYTAYEYLAFARIGEAGFARRLPAGAGHEVLIELKPRAGQSAPALAAWLAEARIASSELMPVLQQRRLGGAQARPLSAQEISQRNVHPSALLFAIRNDSIEIDGQGKVAMFSGERTLMIHGMNPDGAPAAVILYKLKAPRAPRAKAGVDKEKETFDV
jgi:type VI secretion system protein ImpJ